ncbi:MAG: hypothetical protein JWQ43_4092 [Glaciihabitans sp.]|nr:hypothetical protein [Glaciihabitans sp.]
MADTTFHSAQLEGVYSPGVLPINTLVDELRQQHPQRGMPYVAPHYDAANARILSLSSSPGPLTGGAGTSGFLSRENNDPSAERMSRIFAAVGLTDADVLPWNAYPWHVHEQYPDGLPADMLAEGLRPLRRVLEAHPNIRAIVAHGGDAKRSVRLFETKKRFNALVQERGLRVWETRHTSNPAFVMSQAERDAATEKVRQSYREAMEYVGLTPLPSRPRAVARTQTPSGAELVGVVGDALSAITDGHTNRETRAAVRAYLGTMSAGRRTELLIELVTQRLNS